MKKLTLIYKIKRYLLSNNWFRKINNLKKKISFLMIANFNKLIGKTYIPDPRNNINIETTSLCNLKCKFCAYDKRDLIDHPNKTMSVIDFERVLNQCISENYRYIGLSPTTGDLFMDKTIFDKFDLLENNKDILGFYFYTNFIPIKKNLIEKLLNYKKIKLLGLSIYGDDRNTFKDFANSTDNAYYKLVENLKELNDLLNKKMINTNIIIGHRTRKNYNLENSQSEISVEIKDILKAHNTEYTITDEFNNWGGMIQENDVEHLNINFKKNSIKKIGACSYIFSRNIIGSNFDLNACACRDANFTLKLGNVNNDNLGKLLSKKNSIYQNLIKNQNEGNFPDVCKSCDFYKSIYVPDKYSLRQFPEKYINKLEDFFKITN